MGRAALVAVVLLGVFFRMHGLERPVLWHDEAYTRIFASGYQSGDWQAVLYTGDIVGVDAVRRFQHPAPDRGPLDTVLGLARDEPQHPPLYYLLARLWVGWLGDGIGTLRALSALLSLLALPAMGWLAWELLRDRRAAGVAVALLAASPFFVLYAQEAREYALWGALTLASTAQLLRAIRRSEERLSPLPWAIFSVLTALSLYTAFSAAGVILGQIAFICLRERMRLSRVALSAAAAMAVAAALFAPWAVVLHARLDAFRASMAWSRNIVVPRTELLSTLASNLSRPLIDLWSDPAGARWLLVAAAVAVQVGGVVALLRRVPARRALLPLLVGATPLLLLLVPDLLFGGIRSVSARYLTPTAAMSLVALASWLARRPTLLAAVLAVGLLSSGHDSGLQAPWTKGISVGLPEAAEWINRSPRPLVIGDRERHNPGNLLALSVVLRDDASIQMLAMQDPIPPLPQGFGAVYLFSPTPAHREALEREQGVRLRRLEEDLYLSLWEVVPGGR